MSAFLFMSQYTAVPAEVLFCLQCLLTVTHTQEMALVDVQSDDLLKQLIQGLIEKNKIKRVHKQWK